MYSINNKNKKGTIEESAITGIPMGSKNKTYMIDNQEIKDISITALELASPIVSEIVQKKYKKLVDYITSLLVEEDDDTGDSYREALNHIEKFRLEIKNKYRDYLKRKELEIMSKQLSILKKELENRQIQIRENLMNIKEEKRSK